MPPDCYVPSFSHILNFSSDIPWAGVNESRGLRAGLVSTRPKDHNSRNRPLPCDLYSIPPSSLTEFTYTLLPLPDTMDTH